MKRTEHARLRTAGAVSILRAPSPIDPPAGRPCAQSGILAGVATWLTMAYILFVNPSILRAVTDTNGTSLAFSAVLTVTAPAAGLMTVAMGLNGSYPFVRAAAPGWRRS